MQYIYMSNTPFCIIVKPKTKLNMSEEELQKLLKQIEQELKRNELEQIVDHVEA